MGKNDLYLVVYTLIRADEYGNTKTTTKAKLFPHDGLAWTYVKDLEKDNPNAGFEIHWEGWVDG